MMDIRSAKEVFVTAKEGLKSAEENYAMANDRYRTNTGTITELIDAQTKTDRSRSQDEQGSGGFSDCEGKAVL